MLYKQTTQVPNVIFDTYLPELTEAELKILLIIIRQTLGWVDRKTGKRKAKDRLTNTQLQQKTGLSRRVVTKAIQSLVTKSLIQVTDFRGNILYNPSQRKGKSYLYFGIIVPLTSAQKVLRPVHKSNHNKTNSTKTIRDDGTCQFKHIHSVLLPFTSMTNNPQKDN